jgi:hypothetical protein
MKLPENHYTAMQLSKMLHKSDRRIREECAEGKYPGAYKTPKGWVIPYAVDMAPGTTRAHVEYKITPHETNIPPKGEYEINLPAHNIEGEFIESEFEEV